MKNEIEYSATYKNEITEEIIVLKINATSKILAAFKMVEVFFATDINHDEWSSINYIQ